MVLQLFNTKTSYSLQELVDESKLSRQELDKILGSLTDAKILKESSAIYELNMSFSRLIFFYESKRTKIKLAVIQSGEGKEDEKEISEQANAERAIFMEASIVRIMKSRRELSHLELVQEVINQCKNRFNPEISMIKKCIEIMIEKQYIDRIEQATYRYIQ